MLAIQESQARRANSVMSVRAAPDEHLFSGFFCHFFMGGGHLARRLCHLTV
jgi:hypothetical protein